MTDDTNNNSTNQKLSDMFTEINEFTEAINGKSKKQILDDIFSKIKKEGYIKYAVLIGYSGFVAYSCGELTHDEAQIYAGHAHRLMNFSGIFGTQMDEKYEIPYLSFELNKINTDYTDTDYTDTDHTDTDHTDTDHTDTDHTDTDHTDTDHTRTKQILIHKVSDTYLLLVKYDSNTSDYLGNAVDTIQEQAENIRRLLC
ncbi:MAG: hypothetical protein K0B07_03755 [DPANN group archaeon]|nr:hypothetical protein [DPANN group archaeon]